MEMGTRGPVTAGSLLWQRSGGWVLTTICKTVFDFSPGEARLRSTPPAPVERDVAWDPPYARSLRASTDYVPTKPTVDVVLTGHAYAPRGQPVRSFVARLAVGGVDKSIDVTCDRYFDRAGVLHHGPAIAHMPLVYERAAGGLGTWNLAGLPVGQRDANGNLPVPNLTPHGGPIMRPEQLQDLMPAGFGPLPADWPSRVEKLGRRSLRDLPPQWNGQTLPDDLAREYFNCAPDDQQIGTLHEGEQITLENLSASYSTLTCRLPGLRPTATCEVAGQTASIQLRADTLHIDTDLGVCVVIWRGHLSARDPRDFGRLLVVLDAPRAMTRKPTLTGNDAAPAAPTPQPQDASAGATTFEETIAPGISAASLPFAGAQEGAPKPSSLAQSSASWEAVRAPSSLAQSSLAWGVQDTLLPQPPRTAEQSSSAPKAITPPVASSPLAQSGSWGRTETGQDASRVSALPHDFPPPRQGPSAPATPPPVVPPIAKTPATDSPWAAGSAAAQRETIGMQAASGALAIAEPKYEPVQGVGAAPAVEGARVPVHLLWFDLDSVARIRRVQRWRQLLSELERRPLDRDVDDSGSSDPLDIEDRRDICEVLARGGPSYTRSIEEALSVAKARSGKFVPPLVLVEGEIEIQLDELEGLKAAATTAAPLILAIDEGLRAAVAGADAFLARPDVAPTPAVCEGLHNRIREAFVREKKMLPADYLDRQTERSLLTQRHYQRRKVLSGVFLRAMLRPAGEKEILTYLPDDLATTVPIYRRFGVRLIADIHLQQDQHEARPYALRVLALGRCT